MDEEDWDAEITSNTVQAYRPTTITSNTHQEAQKFSFGRGRNFDKIDHTNQSDYRSQREDSASSSGYGANRESGQSRYSRQDNQNTGGYSSGNYENRTGFSGGRSSHESRPSYNRSTYNEKGSSSSFYDKNNNRDDNLTELLNIESR